MLSPNQTVERDAHGLRDVPSAGLPEAQIRGNNDRIPDSEAETQILFPQPVQSQNQRFETSLRDHNIENVYVPVQMCPQLYPLLLVE